MANVTRLGMSRWGPLRTFANRDYLHLWLANFLSYTPGRMLMTLMAWLILELTNSPWLVALVGFFYAVPMLFLGLFGGMLADRLNRHRLVVVLQVVNVMASLLFTVVLMTGAVQVWHGYLMIAVSGAVSAIGSPSRRALIIDVLGTSRLTNAIALEAIGMDGSRMLGPALVGILIALSGATGGFVAITVFYTLSLVLLMTLRVEQAEQLVQQSQSAVRNLAEGFRYVAQSPVMMAVVCITVILNLLFFPYVQMVPVLARDVLHVGPTLMGLLQAAEGVGALVGAVALASIASIRYHGRYFVGGSALAVLMLIVFSMSTWYAVSLPLLFGLGVGVAYYGTMQLAIAMLVAPPEIRGRVLGVTSLAVGAGPLGSILLGAVATAVNPVFAIRTHACIGAVLLGLTVWILPAIMGRTETVEQTSSGSA